MTIWKPDTCDCIVEYSDTLLDKEGYPVLLKVHKKCNLHAPLADSSILKSVLTHNRSFNATLKADITEDELDIINGLKVTERNRIKTLSREVEVVK